MIKYIGSKKKLLPQIEAAIRSCVEPTEDYTPTVVDMFSGAGHVSRHMRSCGYEVLANDMQLYAQTIAQCYLNFSPSVAEFAQHKLNTMAKVAPVNGYFTKNFCHDAMYFQPKNGMRVDGMREWLAKTGFAQGEWLFLIVALMEAADRVDNTTGVQMAYLKKWCKRSYNDLELRVPDFVDGPLGSAFLGPAETFFARHPAKVDVAYLDPPYNQHNYRGNYHIWETLVRWDEPEVYGKARKRVDVKDATTKSDFNSKVKAVQAMRDTVATINADWIVVSFSNEGFISREEMVDILSSRGSVTVQTHDYKRYVGAQIGIHDLQGKVVGTVSHTENKEYIFICKVK